MTAILKRLGESWTGLNVREQGLLVVMSLLIAGLLGYLVVLAPMQRFHAQGRDAYVGALSQYRTLEAGIGEYRLRAAGAASQAVSTGPLTSLVGRTALARDIQLARVLPDEDGRLNVWIDRAPTRDLLGWLVELEQTYGISVTRITLDRTADEFVSAQLILARGAGS
jgi:general secretion pathway protein M